MRHAPALAILLAVTPAAGQRFYDDPPFYDERPDDRPADRDDWAVEDDGVYLTLRAGGVYGIQFYDFDDLDGVEPDDEDDTFYGGVAGIGVETPVALTYDTDWTAALRAEVAYQFNRVEEDDSPAGEGEGEGEDVDLHDLTFNLSVHGDRGGLKPLAGAGVGAYFFEDAVDGDLEYDLAAKGFVGVGFGLTRDLDLEFRATYTYRPFDGDLGLGVDTHAVDGSAQLVLRL